MLQIEIDAAEPVVPRHSPFEIETYVKELESYVLPSIEKVQKWFKQEVKYYVLGCINSFNSVWNKEELYKQWKEFVIAVPQWFTNEAYYWYQHYM